jgi:4-amino-4-deoxy-L-arabinose transferase-like glycosyltransferase
MHRRLALAATLLAAPVAAAGLFARLMNYDMRRDEQLYVSPAALLPDQRLYHDFFYNHVPGSAWYFDAVHLVFGGGGLLFSARIGVFIAWIVFAAAAAFLTWRLARSKAAAVAAVALLVANDFLLGVVGSTGTNNFLPLPFAYVGLCLFALGVRGEGAMRKGSASDGPRASTIAAAGVAMAVALSMKVSAVAFILPVAIASLLLPAGLGLPARFRSVVVPFALGGVVGAFPVLIEIARAPEIFLAHVVQYHTGPHVAFWSGETAGDEEVALGLGAKALLAHQIWFGGVNLLLALTALLMTAARLSAGGAVGLPLLGVAVAGSVAIFGFAPTPSFPQYFAPTAVALLFLIAVSGPAARDRHWDLFFMAIAAAAALVGAPRILQHAPKLASPSGWTVVKVHNAGAAIAAAMAEAGVDGKVLTLLPIYPLEAGLAVYPEFATGQFVYRTGDLTPPALLAKYRTTSPSGLPAFLADDPPAALLLGFEPALEAPMAEFARRNGYRRVEGLTVKDRYGDGYLLVRDGRP